MFHIIKKEESRKLSNECDDVAAAFMENKSSKSSKSIWKTDMTWIVIFFFFKIQNLHKKTNVGRERKKGLLFRIFLTRLWMNSISMRKFQF